MKEIYNTKQNEIILNAIKNKKCEFTAKDIYEELNREVGLTTVYRMIDSLAHDGVLNKAIGNDNNTYFQYMEKCDHLNHFYLKCDKCGSLVHVDCDCIVELINHISKEHGFKTNNEHIIINGICEKCRKKGDKK